MSPRVLFEQDLETLKNKVSEMGEHAEISYDRMVYGIRENKEDILNAAKYRSYVSEPADQTAAGGQRYASGIRSAESGTGY